MSVNNISPIKKPITPHLTKEPVLKTAEKNKDVLPLVTQKNNISTSSMQLPKNQDRSLYESLGYDDPSPQQRSAVNEYIKVSHQQQRDEISRTMGFHFSV
ncbi:MAG: hypothetical protein KAH18_03715 [Psychromonas sp.]|nr:hypothetical protein [Psychromonas sp.]